MATPDPSGCRHCGIDKHDHCGQWSPDPIGWHVWTEPTWQQRRERILARRNTTAAALDRAHNQGERST